MNIGNYDFEDINAIDIPLFNDHLEKLLNGEEVEMPVFNLKNVMSQTPSRFTAGHRMCTGCRSTTNS